MGKIYIARENDAYQITFCKLYLETIWEAIARGKHPPESQSSKVNNMSIQTRFFLFNPQFALLKLNFYLAELHGLRSGSIFELRNFSIYFSTTYICTNISVVNSSLLQ